MTSPVRLDSARPADGMGWIQDAAAGLTPEDVAGHLQLAVTLTNPAPAPGAGRTRERWELFASLAARDLTAARVVEAHLDAVAIIRESGGDQPLDGTTWGVFAAEGPGVRLDATPTGTDWSLSGVKPWCSLAGALSHALVTAHTPTGRRLFAVDLGQPGVHVDAGTWHARGLVNVPSGPVSFDEVPATAVGDTGWYLDRPGFAYGGLGVAACWYGGAVGLARALVAAMARRAPDDIGLWHLGVVDLAVTSSRLALAQAACAVDDGQAHGAAGHLLALRTRSVVAQGAERVLQSVGHALGPSPLALDADHVRRVSDLTLYLRQHHAERDEVALGRVLAAGPAPW